MPRPYNLDHPRPDFGKHESLVSLSLDDNNNPRIMVENFYACALAFLAELVPALMIALRLVSESFLATNKLWFVHQCVLRRMLHDLQTSTPSADLEHLDLLSPQEI
jgi:hypothetical protein